MESVIITTFLRPLLKIEDIFGTGKTEDTTSPSDLKQVKFYLHWGELHYLQ